MLKIQYVIPIAIVGASDGSFGTVRVQNQLLLFTSTVGFSVDAKLRLPISRANKKFDTSGRLIDEQTKQNLQQILNGLTRKIHADNRQLD